MPSAKNPAKILLNISFTLDWPTDDLPSAQVDSCVTSRRSQAGTGSQLVSQSVCQSDSQSVSQSGRQAGRQGRHAGVHCSPELCPNFAVSVSGTFTLMCALYLSCSWISPVVILHRQSLLLIGSGLRYMICVTLFCTLRESDMRELHAKTHRHARIACETHAILACPCVFWLAQRAKKCDKIWYLGPLPQFNPFPELEHCQYGSLLVRVLSDCIVFIIIILKKWFKRRCKVEIYVLL